MAEQVWSSTKGNLAYSAGQPMGIYSSWPAMSLTHHLIVRYSARVAGVPWVGNYSLLGDDLLLTNEKLYDAYLKVTTELGMELSLTKTFKSPRLFEFAKRFFLNRSEVSPFPLGSIIQSNGDLAAIAVGLDNAIHKGWLGKLNLQEAKARAHFYLALVKSMDLKGNHGIIPRIPSILDRTLGLI